MSAAPESLTARLNKLGLTCEEAPTDKLTSATAALCCFPMYMVANVHAWTSAKQFRVPVLDLPGFEAIRESFAIGRQEAKLEITKEHRAVLSTLLSDAKPSDQVIYDYALEGIKELVASADESLAGQIRAAVANMIVSVATAAGGGLLGTGEKVSRKEKECIDHIAAELNLAQSSAAAEILAKAE